MTNILIFSPHPDDAELVIGGIIAKHSLKYKIVIVDLTRGENSVNGNSDIRKLESISADKILGITNRINLEINDCCIQHTSLQQQKKVINIIRKLRPSIIISPFLLDSHPDHKESYYLIKEAYIKAGLCTEQNLGEPYNCKYIYYYSQNLCTTNQSFYFDISDYYNLKLNSINSYKSQFSNNNCYVGTYLNKEILRKIIAKDRYCGSLIGSKYAEELIFEGKLICDNIFDFQKI